MSGEQMHVGKRKMEDEDDALAIMGEALAAISMEVIADATGADRVGMIYDGEKIIHVREGGRHAQLDGRREPVQDIIEVESEVHDRRALPEGQGEDALIRELEDALDE